MHTSVFTKHNRAGFADALRCESRGLARLEEALAGAPLHVPKVYAVDDHRLEMTAIVAAGWERTAWQALGEGLACLHRCPGPGFGLDEDNYIGLNPQKNRFGGARGPYAERWGPFFVACRLGYQVSLIADPAQRQAFDWILERHGDRLADYLDSHCDFPSLVHGDLWRGNALCDSQGRPWLIDPAGYFGDREVDLAMTEMFGGFEPAFYQAYEAALPLSSAYATKKIIYNLYHYLNHYNLFGAGYLAGCQRGFDTVAGL